MNLRGVARVAGIGLGSVGLGAALFVANCMSSFGPDQRQNTEMVMDRVQASILMFAVEHRCMVTTLEALSGPREDARGRPLLLLVPQQSPDGEYALVSLAEDGMVGGEGADADIVRWGRMPGSFAATACPDSGEPAPGPR